MRHAYDEFEEGERVLVRFPVGYSERWRWGTVVDTGVGGEKVGILYHPDDPIQHEPLEDVYHEVDGLAAILLEGTDE